MPQVSTYQKPINSLHILCPNSAYALFVALLLLLAPQSISISHGQESNKSFPKYRGAVLAHVHRKTKGYGSKRAESMRQHLRSVGYNSIQLNSFAYMRSVKQLSVVGDGDTSLSNELLAKEILRLHQLGFSTMLKPHIWVGGSQLDPANWRSNIDFTDNSQRRIWFKSYEAFMLAQAELAERTRVELFVVGTELVKLGQYQKDWRELIEKVKNVYTGKLTYAAEWSNAENIQFWDALDYIAIDAYYPLSNKNNPSVEELINAWSPRRQKIETLAERWSRKIIFTELGYKSQLGTAIRPWEWKKDGALSELEQQNALDAALRTFWNRPYFAGFFIWKYFTDNNSYERSNIERGFTPFGKSAEEMMKNLLKNME